MLLSYETSLPTAESREHDQARDAARAAEIDSLRLLQGQREVRIRHGNEYYRLRHTRNDKLILTK